LGHVGVTSGALPRPKACQYALIVDVATKSTETGVRVPAARPPADASTCGGPAGAPRAAPTFAKLTAGVTLTPDELAAAMHDPLAYPGEGVARTSLLAGDRLVPVHRGDFCRELSRLGAAPMAERTAILAVGTNGSAEQLLARFGVPGTVIPILPAQVAGLRQGFAACVAPRGYVPFAPVADSNARTLLRILWLDTDQLRLVDETAPTHTRTHFDNTFVSAEIYRSRFKVLRDLQGDEPMEVRSQTALLTELCGQEWFADIAVRWAGRCAVTDPARLAATLGRDEGMRAAVRRGFVDNGLVCDDAL
jgi:hypothetical protein